MGFFLKQFGVCVCFYDVVCVLLCFLGVVVALVVGRVGLWGG